jgi:hypothetical protein
MYPAFFRNLGSAAMGLFRGLFKRNGGEGLSPERAVVVESIGEEYEWMRRHCAGLKPVKQSLCHIDGKPYDVQTLRDERGDERLVYFDISSFYGKD